MKSVPQPEPACLEEMIWTPGKGSNKALLRLLSGYFGKPNTPLGEAWFLGETRYIYKEISAQGIEGLSMSLLRDALEESISGMFSFPERSEWSEWFGYLAPRILCSEQFSSGGWHGLLCTGLLALELRNGAWEPAKYQTEWATILSPWIMHPHFWENGCFLPLQGNNTWRDSWGNYGIDVEVSTSLLLTWRHLKSTAVRPWIRSVLAIEDVTWRAQFVIWLTTILPIFEAKQANYAILDLCKMQDLWVRFSRVMIHLKPHAQYDPSALEWSLIPPVNIEALRTAIKEEFDEPTYFQWIDQFSEHNELWPQMETRLEQIQTCFL